jgi:hypothetical protein
MSNSILFLIWKDIIIGELYQTLNCVEKGTGAGGGSGERERLSLPDCSAPSWSHDASDDEEDDIERLHLLRNIFLKMAEFNLFLKGPSTNISCLSPFRQTV